MEQADHEFAVHQHSIAQAIKRLAKFESAKHAIHLLELAIIELEIQILDTDSATFWFRIRNPEDPISKIFLEYISLPAIIERLEYEPDSAEGD